LKIRLRYSLSIIIFILSIGINTSFGQFSSCADPRLEPAPDYRPLPAGTWQFGLTYDYRHLNRLVLEKTELDDESRQRSTRNIIMRVAYGLKGRWYLAAITSEVIKSVEIRLPTIGREKLVTRGIGDSYLIAGYSIIPWTHNKGKQLRLGGGLKIPTGASDLSSEEIAIRTDMQPGSGSVDFLGWGDAIIGFKPGSPAHLRLKTLYKLNTANSDGIRAGDEFNFSAGLLFLPEFVGRLTGYIAYRHIGQYHDDADQTIDNTGGTWMLLGWNIHADIKGNLHGIFDIEMPLSQHVNGTQLDPDFSFSITLQYRLRR
jgi:hypothetical protein